MAHTPNPTKRESARSVYPLALILGPKGGRPQGITCARCSRGIRDPRNAQLMLTGHDRDAATRGNPSAWLLVHDACLHANDRPTWVPLHHLTTRDGIAAWDRHINGRAWARHTNWGEWRDALLALYCGEAP